MFRVIVRGQPLLRGRQFSTKCAASVSNTSSPDEVRDEERRGPSAGASVMQPDAYQEHSHNQYSAHHMSRDMLEESLDRVIASHGRISGTDIRPIHLVDLGAADGSNSMQTLRYLHSTLDKKQVATGNKKGSFKVSFVEHPDSCEETLRDTLRSNEDWFADNNSQHDVIMKSFYEPLFPPSSVDMFLSYICLHWLDTSDSCETDGISTWKRLPGTDPSADSTLAFTTIHDDTVPTALLDYWRKHLAEKHLAKFLCHRSMELRPGGELKLVMVGSPFSWYNLPGEERSDVATGSGSLLTRTLILCLRRGLVRQEVLDKLIMPYYMRRPEEVLAAAKAAEEAGSKLEVVGIRDMAMNLGQGDAKAVAGVYEMCWAIHRGSVIAAGATEEELDHIYEEAKKIHAENFETGGVSGTYLACVFRKKDHPQ